MRYADIDRLDALDEIETLRSIGYTDAEIRPELDDDQRAVLDELCDDGPSPVWTEDDGEGGTTEGW